MAGIYLHIPFCKQACTYCNFHFSTNTAYINDFVHALLQEIMFKKQLFSTEIIETIYFGGGTPSLLTDIQLDSIIKSIVFNYTVASNVEITLEANPENITKQVLDNWKSIGINRLSIGIQSFYDDELLFMNRSHKADQSIISLELISNSFTNYSVDLIFGSHLLSESLLQKNIETILSFKPPHISCYALTVEDKTVLANKVSKNNLLSPSSETQAQQFYFIKNILENQNYNHYEISNYALSGFISKHNSNYWNGVPYLGFGPSAHSYFNNIRSWNVANNALYIKSAPAFDAIVEHENLTTSQQINELLMIGLRTNKGVNIEQLKQLSSSSQFDKILFVARNLESNDLISITYSSIKLTTKGLILADGIASDLFVD